MTPPEVVKMYYAYSRPMDEAELEHYSERSSESLKANPNADLDQYAEISGYLGRQSRQDLEFSERLASQITEPMSADCRAAIIIPVAGHQESANIYRTLESYTGQTANRNLFEIITFVNRPSKDRNGAPVPDDGTRAEIDRFKRDHPEMPVRVMEAEMPGDNPQIGQIRKYANDATLIRHHARGRSADDLIMISNDADSVGIVPEYIQSFIDKFDADPKMDSLLGQVDWDPNAYLRNPLLQVSTRFFQYVEATDRQLRGNVGSSGANFAFRSSIYAGVGGYENLEGAGEDVVFGRSIRAARAGADDGRTPIGFAGTKTSRVYTSARRALVALRDGLSPYEQWNGVFGAFDDEVRKLDVGKEDNPVDFDDPTEAETFRQNLETILNRSVGQMTQWMGVRPVTTGNSGNRNSPIDRSLRYLGIDYDWADDTHIRIKSIDGLIKGLKTYEEDGYSLYQSRTQTS